jgi:hypothetical protein
MSQNIQSLIKAVTPGTVEFYGEPYRAIFDLLLSPALYTYFRKHTFGSLS